MAEGPSRGVYIFSRRVASMRIPELGYGSLSSTSLSPHFSRSPLDKIQNIVSINRFQSVAAYQATSRGDQVAPKNERETSSLSDFSRANLESAGNSIVIQKGHTSYVDSIIIQGALAKNQWQVHLPSSLSEHQARQRIKLLRYRSLKTIRGQHESSFFRGKGGANLTSLKTAVSLENSCGAFSIIGEINCAQKHCLHKFVNLCMKHGKKNKSYSVIWNTLQRLILFGRSAHRSSIGDLPIYGKFTPQRYPEVGEMKPKEQLETKARQRVRKKLILLMKAIENVRPVIEVKKVRISGTTQLVPFIIPKNRQICLAIRWIIEAAILRRNTKKSMSLDDCFFAELIDASQNIGTVRKRRDDLHKLAESNRGFAHYRWW